MQVPGKRLSTKTFSTLICSFPWSTIKLVKKGNAKLLDGEYKWVNDKGHMFADHILKEGVYLQWKEYHKNGNLMTHFDYTKKCEDGPHRASIYLHDKSGKLKESYPCSDNRGGKGVDGGSFK